MSKVKQKIYLRKLLISDKEQFEKAINFKWENEFDFAGGEFQRANCNFEKYLVKLEETENGINLPSGYVNCTWLFAFSNNEELIGRVSIRHSLNEFLLKHAGHIGYGVLPEFRKRGFATEILKQSLNYIKTHNQSIERVLVTCDPSNTGSIRVIEKNGGIIDKSITEMNGIKNRYWINLNF